MLHQELPSKAATKSASVRMNRRVGVVVVGATDSSAVLMWPQIPARRVHTRFLLTGVTALAATDERGIIAFPHEPPLHRKMGGVRQGGSLDVQG